MVNIETETEASRFRALLNPIRDLAASWGIDVAKELTDYAESLGIDLDGDGGLETDAELPSLPVDFAEAALLVQGSTSIYSRKVEHLYGLVYKAVAELNLLRGKDKASGNGTTEPASEDADADKLLDVDKINFLDLDDVKVETADDRAITLPQEDLPPAGSLQDSTTLRPIPRMLMRGNADENNLERSNFKMLTATTHSSGALIMEGCPPVTEDLTALPTADNANASAQTVHMEDDDDRDNDFSGIPYDDDDAGYSTPPPMSSAPFDNEDILVAVASSAKKRREPRLAPVETKKRPKPKKDPFLMLDPHEPIPSLEKPMRVGKTYRKPRKAKDNDSRLQDSLLCDDDLDPNLDLTFGILDPIPGGVSIRSYLCFKGLRRPYREILRKRLAIKRRNAFESNRLVDQAITVEKEDEDLAAEMPGGDTEPHVSFANDDDFCGGEFEDDPDDFPAFPSIEDNGSDDIGGEINEAFESGKRFSEQFEKMASEYNKVCREHLQKTAQLWQQRTADEDLQKRVKMWENRIKPILDEEEVRPAFDITTYGQSVVKRFATRENSTTITEKRMKTLFQAPERYEVCRLFLATLQLANTYTVEIIDSNSNGLSEPSVKLIAQSDAESGKNCTPTRSKRARQPGSTPKSARRPPLRSRLQI